MEGDTKRFLSPLAARKKPLEYGMSRRPFSVRTLRKRTGFPRLGTARKGPLKGLLSYMRVCVNNIVLRKDTFRGTKLCVCVILARGQEKNVQKMEVGETLQSVAQMLFMSRYDKWQ